MPLLVLENLETKHHQAQTGKDDASMGKETDRYRNKKISKRNRKRTKKKERVRQRKTKKKDNRI